MRVRPLFLAGGVLSAEKQVMVLAKKHYFALKKHYLEFEKHYFA